MPLININNVFSYNDAVYAPNIAAFPLKLSLIIYDIYQNKSTFHNDSRTHDLNNIQSGEDLQYSLLFEILDYYNQTVTTVISE